MSTTKRKNIKKQSVLSSSSSGSVLATSSSHPSSTSDSLEHLNHRKTQKKITQRDLWKCYDEKWAPKSSASSSTVGMRIIDEKDEDYTKIVPEADLCTVCGTGIIQWSDENIPICCNQECGVMHHDAMVDPSPEWKFFKSDDKNHGNDPTRCGNPINPLLEESSIGCKIALPNHASSEMRRIKRWMDWQLMPYNEKALYEAFQYITTMAQLAGISKTIIDRACWWYREFSLHEQHRGVKLASLKAASLDMAGREFGCPRTPFEIAEIFKIDKKDAAKGCSIAEDIRNHMSRNQGLETPDIGVSSTTTPSCSSSSSQDALKPTKEESKPQQPYEELFSVSPSSFMERYCSKLKMNQELTVLSRFIAQKIEKESLITDNMPHAISAGIVFFIAVHCRLPITKTEIKQISGISEVTINKCFKKINVFRVHLLPKCILDKYANTS